MASFRISFEKELRHRLSQKATAHQSEEVILLKSFKYFDLNNNGKVELNEFLKVIEKIGIPVFNKQDFIELFNYYDVNGDGGLDYKEFSAIVFGNSSAVTRKSSPSKGANGQRVNNLLQGRTLQDSVMRLRQKLKSRGATGMIGIARQFRVIDEDGSRSLDLEEFKKAMREFGIDMTESEIEDVFEYFDRDHDELVNYDEFLLGVRGPMNQFRRRLAQQAYKVLDQDNSGIVDISDMKALYNAKKHPDVISCKRTEESVLLEFLSTFETYVGFKGIRDSKVTLAEFEDYYTFVSASIDRDDYFEQMMNNAWHINSGADRGTFNKKGWAANYGESSNNANNNANENLQQSYARTHLKSQQNLQQSKYDEEPVKRAALKQNQSQVALSVAGSTRSQQKSVANSTASYRKKENELLVRLRARLATRGTRGFIGIQRQFKIMDDDFDKSINYGEFKKAMNDYKMGLNESEARELFNVLDLNGNGIIEINELVRSLQGEVNEFRRNLVTLAFNKLDRNRDGELTVNDVKTVYSAKNHPDVKKGTRTEDEVLGEFLETFEMHHNLKVGTRDQRITREEFVEYYNNVSANIDNDQYFEVMMVNAYKLYVDHPREYGQYAPTNSRGQPNNATTTLGRQQSAQEFRSKTTVNAPFGTSNFPPDYSTNLRPNTGGNLNRDYQIWANDVEDDIVSQRSSQQSQSNHEFDNYEPVKRASRKQQDDSQSQRSSVRDNGSQAAWNNNETRSQRSGVSQASNSSEALVGIFRKKIASRGTRGMIGLARLYRVIDDDGTKSIDIDEFRKICKEIRVGLDDSAVERLFSAFDRDRSGTIDYDEFVRAVKGNMNKNRLNLVLSVFAKLDKNKNSRIEVDDIIGIYSAKKHPEVVNGRRTEEEVLGDFLDTFEQHLSTKTGKGRDKSVTVEEFVEYYNNVSASIDDERLFEAIIRSAWKI